MLPLLYLAFLVCAAFGEKKGGKLSPLVITSTLDGTLTAVNNAGRVEWRVPSSLGPLLSSTLSSVQWGESPPKLVPSLDGTIYYWEGNRLKPMPVSAETLLSGPFELSNDTTLVGSRQIEVYGIHPHSGKVLYHCSAAGCDAAGESSPTEFDGDDDDVLVVRRIQQTVRSIHPKKGVEIWNFTVGQFELNFLEGHQVGGYTCPPSSSTTKLRLDADKGTVTAIQSDKSHCLWTYRFSSPLTAVWTLEGSLLEPRPLFSHDTALQLSMPFHEDEEKSMTTHLPLKLGSHEGQLYIQPSGPKSLGVNPNPKHHQHQQYHSQWIAGDPSVLPTYSTSTDPNTATTAMSLYRKPSQIEQGRQMQFLAECLGIPPSFIHSKLDTQNQGQCSKIPDKPSTLWSDVNLALLLLACASLIGVGLCLWSFKYRKRTCEGEEAKVTTDQSIESVVPSLDRNPSVISRASSASTATLVSRRSISESFTSTFERDFEVCGFLGTGGFGEVYEVKKPLDGCSYAVKKIRLPTKLTARDKVLREVKALAKLNHPNITRYYSSWEECPPLGFMYKERPPEEYKDQSLTNVSKAKSVGIEKAREEPFNQDESSFIQFEAASWKSTTIESEAYASNEKFSAASALTEAAAAAADTTDSDCNSNAPVYLFIQMELCEKKTLSNWLSENQRGREHSYIVSIFKQVVSAVEYVHTQGMMHRDLKPSNILFAINGSVKIGDFGLVTYLTTTKRLYFGSVPFKLNTLSSRHTGAVGTKLYMSPEQVAGRPYSEKVDIFSLGVIFFELLIPFATQMERHKTLSEVQEQNFPVHFKEKYKEECDFIGALLANNPDKRPDARTVKENPLLTIATGPKQ